MDIDQIRKIFKDYNRIEARASILATYHAGIMDINNYYFDSIELEEGNIIVVLLIVRQYEEPDIHRYIHINIEDLFDKNFEDSLKNSYNKKMQEKKTP